MAEPQTPTFGAELREARERVGLDLETLAATTRIQQAYLKALEAEDWAKLPGGVIGRGFVRVLAREVRVPAEELVARYRAARGEEDGEPRHELPESDWKVSLRGERGGRPVRLVALLLLGAVVGIWIWSPWSVERSEAPPAAGPAVAPPAEPVTAPTPAPAAEPAAPPALQSETAEPSPPPQEAAPQEVAAPVPSRAVLEISAVEKVWVRVAPDGAAAADRVFSPGEQRSYELESGVTLKFGNAGGVRLRWNGETLKVPGAPGQVKTVSLPQDLDALRP